MTNAIKKYETVPKRKQMISDSMFHYLANLASCASEDSLVCLITDWIALGCYTGFHKSEWCSDNHDVYVGPRFENGPLSIMDDPASILRRAVPVLMTGPVNCPFFQYWDANSDSGRPVSILRFLQRSPF